MAPVMVRFHPAAAREAESAYDWYAARNPSAAHGFREELRQAIEAVAGNPLTCHVMDAVRDGTPSRVFPSAWYIEPAAMKSRFSPSLTVGDGRATGARGSERPANFRIERPSLRAAPDPGR
jgi:plasmid stabilization system protein ParE